MHWSAALVLCLAGSIPTVDTVEVATTTNSQNYSSYTQAWNAAHEAERPMLVILNPAEGTNAINADSLRNDEKLQPLLNDYVVAVIDTTTDHGKQVYELFESPALPRVVVIDKNQKKQLYRTSAKLNSDAMATVLKDHKDGLVKVSTSRIVNIAQPAGYCPSCQQQQRYSF